ncbi:MAG: 2-nitropropane dioxygenase, partial [Deltaproteobacteria bacterium]|nr:2-nitropropane dioxygenase [Deltaproteobacteria bacterium]
KTEAQFEVEKFWMGALKNAVQDGDIERGSLMAGQCVGLVNKTQSIREIFDEMIQEGEQTLEKIVSKLNA